MQRPLFLLLMVAQILTMLHTSFFTCQAFRAPSFMFHGSCSTLCALHISEYRVMVAQILTMLHTSFFTCQAFRAPSFMFHGSCSTLCALHISGISRTYARAMVGSRALISYIHTYIYSFSYACSSIDQSNVFSHP